MNSVQRPGFWLIWLYIVLLTILLLVLLHERGFDDPYITYRYAVNIAQGEGFVYNTSERVLSTTAPFYALLLAVGAWMGLDVPLLSNAFGCLSLALGGLIFWHLGKIWNARLVGMTGLLLYPTVPLLLPTLGAEVIVAVTLILAGFLCYAQWRYLLVAVALALATLIRADSVLAVGVLGGHCLLYRRHALPWHALFLYGLLLLPWFGFAWYYFGAPLPVTLAAKQQQGLIALSEGFFTGFRTILAGYWHNPHYHLHVLLSFLGLLHLLFYQRHWLILLAWNGLYIAAYTALGVTRYFWYYGPLAVGYVTLIGLGITLIARLVRRFDRRLTRGIVMLLLLLLLMPQGYLVSYLHNTNDARMGIYRTVGEWLRMHTPPDASIGTLEVGIIGYYAERRMVDFAGLIQPVTALQLTPTTTYQDAALWSFQHFRPTHLVLHTGMLPRLKADALFQQHCQAVATFETVEYPEQLTVYTCSW